MQLEPGERLVQKATNAGRIIVLSGLVAALVALGVATGSGTASAAPVTIDIETDYEITSITAGGP